MARAARVMAMARKMAMASDNDDNNDDSNNSNNDNIVRMLKDTIVDIVGKNKEDRGRNRKLHECCSHQVKVTTKVKFVGKRRMSGKISKPWHIGGHRKGEWQKHYFLRFLPEGI